MSGGCVIKNMFDAGSLGRERGRLGQYEINLVDRGEMAEWSGVGWGWGEMIWPSLIAHGVWEPLVMKLIRYL